MVMVVVVVAVAAAAAAVVVVVVVVVVEVVAAVVVVPEKYYRVKYQKCCTFLHFFTLKILQVIQEEGVWHCILRPKMSFWISDWACNLF
jgi:hypothetical protein